MAHILQQRITRRYVGSYQHEDEWRNIGDVNLYMGTIHHTDEEDLCDPTRQEGYVAVHPNEPTQPAIILEALRDTFTKAGCHHEYDCCGCRSYYASAEHVALNVYHLKIRSSRNY